MSEPGGERGTAGTEPDPWAPPPEHAPLLPPDARRPPRPVPPQRPSPPAGRPGPSRSGPPLKGGLPAGLLSLLGLFLATDPVPWSVVALACGVGGAVLGARLLVRARRAGAAAPGALVAVVAGGVAALIALQVVVLSVANRDELGRYRECVAGANTVTARADCRSEFADLRQRLWFLGVR